MAPCTSGNAWQRAARRSAALCPQRCAYQASSRKTTHSTAKMIITPTKPLLLSPRLLQVIPMLSCTQEPSDVMPGQRR